MKPHGKGIELENSNEVETVAAAIAGALFRPNVKLSDPATQNRCRSMLSRFLPFITSDVPIAFPQFLNESERRALTVVSDVAAEHTATAVRVVGDVAKNMSMSRQTTMEFLTLYGDPLMVGTAMLATDANVALVAGLAASLAELSPQPPTPPEA